MYLLLKILCSKNMKILKKQAAEEQRKKQKTEEKEKKQKEKQDLLRVKLE